MNLEPPHDIVRIPAGKKPQRGYVPITEKEAELLGDRTPDERAAWLKERFASMSERFRRASRRRDRGGRA